MCCTYVLYLYQGYLDVRLVVYFQPELWVVFQLAHLGKHDKEKRQVEEITGVTSQPSLLIIIATIVSDALLDYDEKSD